MPGLFAGCGPRVLQTSVMSGIFFLSFEALKAHARQTLLVPVPIASWQQHTDDRNDTAYFHVQQSPEASQRQSIECIPQLASTAQPLVEAGLA